jgi:uncharacterized protein YfeS
VEKFTEHFRNSIFYNMADDNAPEGHVYHNAALHSVAEAVADHTNQEVTRLQGLADALDNNDEAYPADHMLYEADIKTTTNTGQ